MCTCFSSSCEHAFSCHGETVATWVPSPWERHRGGSDLGTHQQKVRSLTVRDDSLRLVQGQPSTLTGAAAANWNSFKTFQLLHSRPRSSLRPLFSSSFFFCLCGSVQTSCHAGYCAYLCGSSDSHLWKLCGCVM